MQVRCKPTRSLAWQYCLTMFNALETNDMAASLLHIIPLDRENRSTLPTAEAAYHLNRQAQTLRTWACHENGPIRPIRLNGRLAWRVADIRMCLGAAS